MADKCYRIFVGFSHWKPRERTTGVEKFKHVSVNVTSYSLFAEKRVTDAAPQRGLVNKLVLSSPEMYSSIVRGMT